MTGQPSSLSNPLAGVDSESDVLRALAQGPIFYREFSDRQWAYVVALICKHQVIFPLEQYLIHIAAAGRNRIEL